MRLYQAPDLGHFTNSYLGEKGKENKGMAGFEPMPFGVFAPEAFAL